MQGSAYSRSSASFPSAAVPCTDISPANSLFRRTLPASYSFHSCLLRFSAHLHENNNFTGEGGGVGPHPSSADAGNLEYSNYES